MVCRSSFKQTPHIKEEEEELWTNQPAEHLDEQENANITAVPLKKEDDEEKPHRIKTEDDTEGETPTSSSDDQIKAETDEEDCGAPEPARNPGPDRILASDSSATEVSDDDYWQKSSDSEPETQDGNSNVVESRTPESGPDQDADGSAAKMTFSCSDCGKLFFCKYNLKRHKQVHSGEKPFGCKDCDKIFLRKTYLKAHMRVHRGERPYWCGDCGKRFCKSSNLKRHRGVHTGEKPFSCSHCGKKFTRNATLTTHMKVHTVEKPFQCSVCGKEFTRQDRLTSHFRIHAINQFVFVKADLIPVKPAVLL